jgi:hypothetical protein
VALDNGTLVELVVGDDAAAWRTIGFTVDEEGTCRVGATRLRFEGATGQAGGGIVGWTLAGVTVPDGDLDGLPTTVADGEPDAPAAGSASPPLHANGAVAIDHVVVITPDLDRTTAAIEAAGPRARRTREAGRGRLQRFFRLGEVILELVGPAEPSGGGPATFWGMVFTVADIDATAALLAGRIGEPKAAVQSGRRIATLRGVDEVSVPVAFMSADERRADPPGRGADRSL